MDLKENCVALVNIDSPGSKGAVEVGVATSGTVSDWAADVIRKHTGQLEVDVHKMCIRDSSCMIDELNRTRNAHIITIEDPIEYLHRHQNSIVSQREVAGDTVSYVRALRAALRQSPDVILLGEMRDYETIDIAMTAAETGQLVLSTLHTLSLIHIWQGHVQWLEGGKSCAFESALSLLKFILGAHKGPLFVGEAI